VIDARSAHTLPSATDDFVGRVSQRIGGPLGRYAAAGRAWWNPLRITLLVGTMVYLTGVVFRLPCRITEAGQPPQDHFKYLCYSDIGLLYAGRGLLQGNTPYLDSGDYPILEYPVLTGWFLELERLITRVLGGLQGPGLTDQQQVDSTLIFVDVNTVLLGAWFLIALWALVRTPVGRPWDAMMMAASPCVAAAALINWDMLPVALTALAMAFWSARKPGLTGVMLGLGAAAKLYPTLLLGPLLLLCMRGKKMGDFVMTLSTFLVSWGLVNLPVLLLAPDAWFSFWQYNRDRGGDFGSIWYVLSLICCLGILILILYAPQRPRFGAMAFLVMAAFLMTNKVYSPQYVLWLLPLMILARPKWRDWLVFTAGELIYFVAIWWHLGGFLTPGDSSPDRIYWLSVVIRLFTQGWVVIMVIRDALRPQRDPVRREGVDDPTGGVLDEAQDARWYRVFAGTTVPRRNV